MSMAYIRERYQVPARRGARIRWAGAAESGYTDGTIVAARGQYLRVRFDRDPSVLLTLHPTRKVEYL